MAGNPTEEYKQDVENKVESLIENLRQFSIIIEDFQEDSQRAFEEKVNQLVQDMIALDSVKDQYSVEVPIGVLRWAYTFFGDVVQ